MKNKSKKDKALKTVTQEKIVNDFLLQFTYSIFAVMLLMYIYNGRMFKYGNSIGLAMPAVIWVLFAIFFVLGIFFVFTYKNKGKNGFKTAAIYMFVSAAGMFWCIGFETLMNVTKIIIPFYNAMKMMRILFGILGLSVVVEFVIYFVRSAKIK